MKPFLTARWSHLLNLTYRVPPDLLLSQVPAGTKLDIQGGSAFVSIVAFDFLKTRVKGIPIPFHINFPEINLRYYLHCGDKRGVAFLKELVPRSAIAWVARNQYNEPYESTPMTSRIQSQAKDRFSLQHDFKYGGSRHQISAEAGNRTSRPAADSIEHYFKEHEWGYGTDRKGRTLCYQVKHPVWEVFDLHGWELNMDIGKVYGPEWAFLNEEDPYCVCLAKGSKIEVYAPFLLDET